MPRLLSRRFPFLRRDPVTGLLVTPLFSP
jgi:hypothetical protein